MKPRLPWDNALTEVTHFRRAIRFHSGCLKEVFKMAGILWTIIVILFIFWLLGFLVWHVGGIIHLLLVVAVIVLLFNLFTGRSTVA